MEKTRLLWEMQIAVIAAVVIAVLAITFYFYVFFLEILPTMLLAHALYEFRKKYKKEFLLHLLIFSTLFFISLILPLVFKYFIVVTSPYEAMRYWIFAIILLVILFLLKYALSKNWTIGEVLLADKNTAVVECDFDLIAGIKAGRYVVKNKGARKGQRVRVKIKKGLFRQPAPFEVIK
jgi:uncharacterized membrane protein